MRQLLTDFRADRLVERRTLVKRVNPAALVEDAIRRGRAHPTQGRDENGNPFRTLTPESFSIQVNLPFITFTTARDDKNSLASLPRAEADRLVRARHQDRALVSVATDIYRAVRLFHHIREGYRAEFLATALVEDAESLNADLATSNATDIKQRADALVQRVDSLIEALSFSSTGSKLISIERLEEAKAALLATKGLETMFNLQSRIGPACALLVAVRNRLGKLRDEEILTRGSNAYLKECALRPVRDDYVRAQLTEWHALLTRPGFAFAVQKHWKTDMELVLALEKVSRSTVSKVLELATQADVRLIRFQELVSRARVCSDSGNHSQAVFELKMAGLVLAANKPGYIVEQLEKTGDVYLVGSTTLRTSFLAYLKSAVQAFEGGAMLDAQRLVKDALRRI